MSFICAIGTAVPPVRIEQGRIAVFMADALQLTGPDRKRMLALYRLSGIEHRHSVLPDYGLDPADFTFYSSAPGLLPFPTVAQRMAVYRQEALPLAAQAAHHCLDQARVAPQQVTHLIVVSCTGMYAPGLDIELVEALGLRTTVQRTCVNFMGCYASFNALKLADAACRADVDARVLIVGVELCTLHFQNRPEEDHLVSNALFGDGAAAVLVQSQPTPGINLELERFHCDLATAGKAEMAWHIGDHGFEMTLTSYVPELIRNGIRNLTERLMEQLNLELEQIPHFAIHPGGTRILKVIEEALNIPREANVLAYEVLRNYGNMSSVTVLFVLNALMQHLGPQQTGDRVLSFAFGPGLTMESMLLRTLHV